MQKIILSLAIFLVSSMVMANPNQKLSTIKQMYQVDQKVQQGNPTLILFSDRSLQRAFELIPKGELCGVEHDVMWQSQDPDYQARLTFSKEQNERVRVKIGSTLTVTYSLACDGSACKITDAFDLGKKSVKKSLIDGCS